MFLSKNCPTTQVKTTSGASLSESDHKDVEAAQHCTLHVKNIPILKLAANKKKSQTPLNPA